MDLKKLIGDLFGFNKELEIALSENELLHKELTWRDVELGKLKSEIAVILSSDQTLKLKVKELEEMISKKSMDEVLEADITSKRPKIQRNYSRFETDGQYSIDVRNFFQINDANTPVVTGKTNDDKALAALRTVRGRVAYNSDKSTYTQDEYWAYAYQTLTRAKGDCEDGAILLANILIKSGVPYWRVRLNAGSVNGGGHAYVTYCRETDNEFVVLDWCYWPNDMAISLRPTHREERNYMNTEKNFYVWFSWDMKYVYGEEKLPTAAKKMFE
jgi:predicted transglutaminase-like cysteine proteinase